MTAETWIKECGYNPDNIEIVDEDIKSKTHYDELYEKSNGSTSGDGFCFFHMGGSSAKISSIRGLLYRMSEKIEKEVFPEEPLTE